jgi:hypothetical protein
MLVLARKRAYYKSRDAHKNMTEAFSGFESPPLPPGTKRPEMSLVQSIGKKALEIGEGTGTGEPITEAVVLDINQKLPVKMRTFNGVEVNTQGSRAYELTDYRGGTPRTYYFDTNEERQAYLKGR